MTLHLHPITRKPSTIDWIMCGLGVAVSFFFLGMVLRAAFNLIF